MYLNLCKFISAGADALKRHFFMHMKGCKIKNQLRKRIYLYNYCVWFEIISCGGELKGISFYYETYNSGDQK